IAIIGAAGNMGQWLIKYYVEKGHDLIASDPNEFGLKSITETFDVELTDDNVTAVHNADLVVVSVPMEAIAAVIQNIAPHMKRNAILCEIASIKAEAFQAMKNVSSLPIHPLCIHPLFGPGARTLKKKIALIPLKNPEEEKRLVDKLFPESEVIIVDAEEHDKSMALTISLPYFVNMIVASVLKDEDMDMLRHLGGTTFVVQLMLTGSIMSNDSALHASLHRENRHVLDILRKFYSRAEQALAHLEDDNGIVFEQAYNGIKETLEGSMSLTEKYEEMYRVLEVLDSKPRLGVKT
ncbi:MAG: prephenate dehydrogenase/arogenate dehydrogenase family protein, partial [Candidatus Thorarchaeota archaeon]